MNIIGITGQAGSGKDSVADRLVVEHGYTKIALADPIKRFGKEIFGFTDKQLWGPSENRNLLDPRYDHYCRLRIGGKVFDTNTKLDNLVGECDPGWLVAAKCLQRYGNTWLQEVLPGADVATLHAWMCALGATYPRVSPRIVLQHLGTEWGRQVADENIWVNCMLRNAQLVLDGADYDRLTGVVRLAATIEKVTGEAGGGIVVSDVRFANELAAIKHAGGKVIQVLRRATDKHALRIGIQEHASELAQQSFVPTDFDVIIQNNKTLDELLEHVDVVAGTL